MQVEEYSVLILTNTNGRSVFQMALRSASTQSRSSWMNSFLLSYMVSFPIVYSIVASQKRKRLEEESAKRKESKALNFGDHPKRNLVKGRRTVEDDWCSWCEFLPKKHEECVKLHGSDEPLCNVFKNGWLKDCATSEGKPK